MLDFKSLPHKGIQNLSPYIPGKPVKALEQEFNIKNIIKLASNENPFGCSPKVKEVLANMSFEDISMYPSPALHPCLDKLAKKLNIPKEYITFANGTDALFGYLQTCFALHNNKHILTHKYAFIAYQIHANALGLETKVAKVKENFEIDIENLLSLCDEKTALIFLPNPNNPTASYIDEKSLLNILNNIPKSTILVLDEAYYEFVPKTHSFNSVSLLDKYPNLVITRTFSKIYGLAGLRLGYAIAHPDITFMLHKILPPFTVSTIALDCAYVALDDYSFVQKTLDNNNKELIKITAAMDAMQIKMIPSYGNFYLLEFKNCAEKIYNNLQTKGLIVRPLSPYGLNDYIRVSIGTDKQNECFLNTLKLFI